MRHKDNKTQAIAAIVKANPKASVKELTALCIAQGVTVGEAWVRSIRGSLAGVGLAERVGRSVIGEIVGPSYLLVKAAGSLERAKELLEEFFKGAS